MNSHFNQLTPAELELLACLAEECGEVVQMVGKILRHGYESRHPKNLNTTNRELLQNEVGDIMATVDLLIKAADLNEDEIDAARLSKHHSRAQYFHHQSHHVIEPTK